jgi:phage baseplate assembly protein W
MKAPRYRAWEFILPDFEAASGGGGLRINPRGGISMVEENDAIRQSILLLLATIPGERIMHPDYGSYLHRLVFASNDDTTAGLAKHYVERALTRWEPRIEILQIDAGRDPDHPEMLEISLAYRVRATQITQSLVLAMNLAGEEV